MGDDEKFERKSQHARQSGDDGTEQPHDNAAILIYTTFPGLAEAKSAGRDLVAKQLAACVNIFPQMTSIYVWDGQTEETQEVVMLVKTVERCRGAVLEDIKRLHPYDVPARMVLPVTGGGEDFLAWIRAHCRAE